MAPATATATNLVPFEPKSAELANEEAVQARIAKLKTEFGQRIVTLLQTANITVVDKASCESAVALRSTIGAIVKEIQAGFEDEKAYYFRKHREVCAEENALVLQLTDPKYTANPDTIDGKLYVAIQTWTTAEDERRRAEERRLEEEQRQANEARAATEAAAHEAVGDHEMAAAIIEEAIAAPMSVVVLPNVRTEVAGLKTKEDWRWRFTGGPTPPKQADILKHTPSPVLEKAMKLIPRDYCQPDVKLITDHVGSMKAKAKIPGIEVYMVKVPVR